MLVTLSGSPRAGALIAVLLACGCTSSPKAERALPGPSAAPLPAEDREAPGSDEIRPVYPADAGAPDPLAQRFCGAVELLPEQRRAECCGASGGLAEALGESCVRTLSFALAQRAVTLAAADVDRCVEAMTRATSGCDWITPRSPALPPECEGVVKGALQEKAPCRSSLECPEGERCLGLSTVDLGRCGPPKSARSPCNVAVDTLATFTRQDHLDRTHPECEGYCGHGRCEDVVAEGGTCALDRACGRGRCASGKCTSALLPAVGEACSGACAGGARCAQGKCSAPRAEGEGCEQDAECRGACVRADGGVEGSCAKSCPVFAMPRTPAVAPRRAPSRPAPRRR